MRFRVSTIFTAAVTVAYIVYLALEFGGVVGNHPGKLPAGMLAMLILLLALLAADVSRTRRKPEADR